MSLLRRRGMMKEIGGGEMIRGSFTPETNLTEYSIELERECNNFILQKNTTNLGYGVRTILGTTPAGNTDTHCIEFSGKVVTIKGSSSSQPGYLVPEQYNYIAW